MKEFVLSIVLLGWPLLFPAPRALAGEGRGAASEGGIIKITGNVHAFLANKDEETSAGNAWLGVSIQEVPSALAAQLDLQDSGGILITNVAKASPADRAELRVHDIILSIDGEPVGTDVAEAVRRIADRRSGDLVSLEILRAGKAQTMTIQLGERPDGEIAWKFQTGPGEEIRERIHTKGKIIGKKPTGEIFIKDLGDVDEIVEIPDEIKEMISNLDKKTMRVFVDGNKKHVVSEVERDGVKISVEQVDDGEITVTRTEENGETVEQTYANKEELQKADPEAYALLSDTGNRLFISIDKDGGNFTWNELFDNDTVQWREEFEERMAEAREAIEEARQSAEEALREALEQLHQGGGAGFMENFERLLPGRLGALGTSGKPRHSFELNEDGSINVRIRRGDGELVRKFAGENDLRARAPRLYEKYQDIMSAESEKE